MACILLSYSWMLQGGFCCCSFLFFILSLFFISFLNFILLLLFFISFPGCFSILPALHPGFSGLRKTPTALSSTPTTFDCLCFSVYRERYGFEWAFFPPQALFKKLSLYALYSFRTLFACSNSYVKTL